LSTIETETPRIFADTADATLFSASRSQPKNVSMTKRVAREAPAAPAKPPLAGSPSGSTLKRSSTNLPVGA